MAKTRRVEESLGRCVWSTFYGQIFITESLDVSDYKEDLGWIYWLGEENSELKIQSVSGVRVVWVFNYGVKEGRERLYEEENIATTVVLDELTGSIFRPWTIH